MHLNLKTLNYILIPVIAALIGWITNYIAVKMLFRPRKAINILGIKIQGLVPKRQNDLAIKIAETIEQNLISHKDIQQIIKSTDSEAQIETLIRKEIEIFLDQKISSIPLIGMFLKGDLLAQIKESLILQLKEAIPRFLDSIMGKIEKEMDFKEIVRKKIEAFDLGKLEEIILSVSAKELKTIEILGGVLGFAVGICQLFLLSLSS